MILIARIVACSSRCDTPTATRHNHKVNRFNYNLLFHLVLPFILLRLLWRAVKSPAYARRWGERLGMVGKARAAHTQQQWIWVHAVSVGESIAAAPLIRLLRQTRPEFGIVVTTMTPTGSERVDAMLGDEVCHVYAPYDYSGAVKRFLKHFQPALVVLMETELWPNIVHYSKQSGARVMVLNARLSEKSFRGYQKFATLGRPMLQQIDCIAAQADNDAERFGRLGVAPERLHITGSIKFEVELPSDLDEKTTQMATLIEGKRPVWIAASTRNLGNIAEEEKVIAAYKLCLREIPDLLLILVPRHPERFAAVEKLCKDASLTVVRRSSAATVSELTNVFLGDSMGEMPVYYSLSTIAFVGGSLVNTGCQNVLEPAALGIPIITGPSQFNFQSICEQLQEAGALKVVRNETELAETIIALLTDATSRERMAAAGLRTVAENKGALQRSLQLVQSQLDFSQGY